MTDVRFDLGYDRDPYPPLRDVLASRPSLAERCAANGWWTGSNAYVDRDTAQARLRSTVARATAPRITVQALARAAGVSPRTVYGFIEGRTLQPANADRLRAALHALLGEEVNAKE